MKTPRFLRRILALALLALAPVAALAQGTAFTYQGRLDVSNAPAKGVYDLRFRLYDAETNGAQVGGTVLVGDLPVTNGLFTVALDFGSGPFSGNDRWLQIGVRPGGSTAPYTILDPLQPLTPAPYAIYAAKADAGALTGTLLDARLSTNVARRTGGNVFSGSQTFTGSFQVTNNNGAFRYSGFAPSADGTTLTASLEGAGTNWPRLRFEREAGGTFMDVGQNASGDFQVKASGNERFTVMNNGNVGIGTDTPSNRLEVAGTVKAAAFVGLVSATNLTSGTVPDARLSANVALRGGGNTFTGNQAITSGVVGIGTAPAPGVPLAVGGEIKAVGPLAALTFQGRANTNANWQWRADTNRADFGVFGSQSLSVTESGNVGIGTTTPDYKLDVNGLINVAGIRFPDGSILRSAIGLPNADPPIDSTNFTTAGTYSWTAPSNAASIVVDIKGGGGGGGGGGNANDTVWLGPLTQSGVYTASVRPGGTGGGGGGEGNSQRFHYLVTPGTTYTIVVGAGGAAGAAAQNGGAGGSSFFGIGHTAIATAPGGRGGVGGFTIPTTAAYTELFWPTGGVAGVAGVVAPGGIVTTNQSGRFSHRSGWFYMPENWDADSPINTINSSFRWTSGPYPPDYNDVPQPAGDGGPGTGGAAGVGAARNAVYNYPPAAVADYYLNREATPGQPGLPGKVSFTIY